MVGVLLGGLAAFQIPACGSSSEPEELCETCVSDGQSWVYDCFRSSNNKYKGSVCLPANSDAQTVAQQCSAQFGIFLCGLNGCFGQVNPCDGQGDTGSSCSGYSPGSHVSFSSGIYHVDEGFVEDLVADPRPLLECDAARVEPLSAGKYKVVNAASSSLLYKLGLRNNDIPQSLNGMPLADAVDGAQAFGDLYLNGVTTYTLVVKRGGANITLYYEIVP